MKAEIKRRWIEALRSGLYEQGTDALRNGDKFCCLGVLCDIYAEDNLDGKWVTTGPEANDTFVTKSDECSAMPTRDVQDWCGGIPGIVYEGDSHSPQGLNDCRGLTFEQIADLLEEHL